MCLTRFGDVWTGACSPLIDNKLGLTKRKEHVAGSFIVVIIPHA
jgi:hypothetical protein